MKFVLSVEQQFIGSTFLSSILETDLRNRIARKSSLPLPSSALFEENGSFHQSSWLLNVGHLRHNLYCFSWHIRA